MGDIQGKIPPAAFSQAADQYGLGVWAAQQTRALCHRGREIHKKFVPEDRIGQVFEI